jgi:hypothetical protein
MIQSMTPSVASPRPLGTQVSWTVTATDSNPNLLTFQFNVGNASRPYSLVRDFNVGTQSDKTWTAQPFNWTTIAGEGTYNIEVIAKDFVSGETATQIATFTLTSRVTGAQDVVNQVENPLVALFSAPSCASGSSVRVAFYTGTNPAGFTNWVDCNPHVSTNIYVAGMLPSSIYAMYSQTKTSGGTITNGAKLSFTTRALPTNVGKTHEFPTFQINTAAGPQSDTNDSMIFWGFSSNVMPVATDLKGNIMWYYPGGSETLPTRVIPGGNILTIQGGTSWNSSDRNLQLLREVDLAGNIVRETNTGIVAHQLYAMGVSEAASCLGVPNPAPVGKGCLNDFDHEAIRFSVGSNSYTAILPRFEKIFSAGTQGSDPKGPPVDILGDMVVVLDSQWQVAWYFNEFQQLDINRAAVLNEIAEQGESCAPNSTCKTVLLLAAKANDWTHSNSIQYLASNGDLLVSLRDQDWVIEVNYQNGAGSGDVVWRMGQDGDFQMMAPEADTWPWFSHQHDAGYTSASDTLLTVFDNGNTRIAPAPHGVGKGNSRGMALTVDTTTMQVTPVITVDLGTFCKVMGAAQLLSDGLYFFQPATPNAIAIEELPKPGGLSGTQVLNILSPSVSYRAWQMPNLYAPPAW